MKSSRHTTGPVFYFSFGTIGDFLMTLSFLENIHENQSHSSIHVITTKNGPLLRDMAAEYPFISVHDLSWRNAFRFLSFLFQRSLVITPWSFGRIPLRMKAFAKVLSFPFGRLAGYDDRFPMNSKLYDVFLPFNKEKLVIENLWQWLPILGFEKKVALRFKIPSASPSVVPKGRFIVVHAFAANPKRSFPVDRWRKLLSFLVTQDFDQIILTGSKENSDEAQTLSSISQKIKNFSGKLSIIEVAHLLNRATLFVGVDTGITHLASVLNRPSVVIGNLSNPTWLPKYNDKATILTSSENCECVGDKTGDCWYEIEGRKYFRCMLDITDKDIEEAVISMIKHHE